MISVAGCFNKRRKGLVFVGEQSLNRLEGTSLLEGVASFSPNVLYGCAAVAMQFKLLPYGQKGWLRFELRLLRVPQVYAPLRIF